MQRMSTARTHLDVDLSCISFSFCLYYISYMRRSYLALKKVTWGDTFQYRLKGHNSYMRGVNGALDLTAILKYLPLTPSLSLFLVVQHRLTTSKLAQYTKVIVRLATTPSPSNIRPVFSRTLPSLAHLLARHSRTPPWSRPHRSGARRTL